jgi:hypothetical protein
MNKPRARYCTYLVTLAMRHLDEIVHQVRLAVTAARARPVDTKRSCILTVSSLLLSIDVETELHIDQK